MTDAKPVAFRWRVTDGGTPGEWDLIRNASETLKRAPWVECEPLYSAEDYEAVKQERDELQKALKNSLDAALELAKRIERAERERDEAQAILRKVINDVEQRGKNGVVDLSHGLYCEACALISKIEEKSK